ncbi:hypothetical protein D9M72_547900 [compost metagenome]
MPQCWRYPRCHGQGRLCCGVAYRRHRGCRRRSRRALCAPCRRPAHAWSRLEPAEHLCLWRPFPFSLFARYRSGPQRGRQGSGARQQRAEDHARSFAHERAGLLGYRRAVAGAPGGVAFQRSCALPAQPQPDGPSARRDQGYRRARGYQFRRAVPARRRDQEHGHAALAPCRPHRLYRRAYRY